MRVLLSDGSGLTARQVAGRLATRGHRVEVLSPDPSCLCRFTRHTHRVHVPAYGTEPFAWLDAALGVHATGGFDVLFPTQDQVAILAHRFSRWGRGDGRRDERHCREPAKDPGARAAPGATVQE